MRGMRPSIDTQSLGIFQLGILVLSIIGLAGLVIDALFALHPEASKLIQRFDLLICALFFWDFLRQFHRAQSKLAYMKFGWIDLLASIPAIDVLRWGRLARVFQILRVIRAVRGTQKIFGMWRKRGNVSGALGLAVMLTVMLGSLLVLSLETSPDSNIKTAGDALWWALTTITTVGYGDLYPVTAGGRAVAAAVMLAGVGMFGSLTALIASLFVAPPPRNDAAAVSTSELAALRAEIAALRAEVGGRAQGN